MKLDRVSGSRRSRVWLKSGRFALFYLLKQIESRTSRKHVLLPAYHCRSIVDACTWAGFVPILYEVNKDLSPNLDRVSKCLIEAPAAVMLIHYFGFPNVSEEFIRLCGDASVPVIEDACHVDYPMGQNSKRIGVSGDWIFSSPRKFYDIYDGGYLACRKPTNEDLGPEIKHPRYSDEARAVKFQLERSLRWLGRFSRRSRYGPSPDIAPEACSSESQEGNSDDLYEDPRFTLSGREAMTNTSRICLSISNSRVKARRRRQNFEHLAKLLAPARRCRALYESIPGDVSPYVFPVLLSEPGVDHRKLRSRGINVLRWEDLAPSSCETSHRYEKHLVQLPLDWRADSREANRITAVLIDVLT